MTSVSDPIIDAFPDRSRPRSFARAVKLLVLVALVAAGSTVAVAPMAAADGPAQSGTVEDSATDGGFTDVLRTEDGYVLVGWVETAAGDQRGWVVKTNESGAVEWNRTVGRAGFARFLSITRASNGSYVVAGTVSDGRTTDGWIARFGPNGSTEWTRRLDQRRADGLREVVPASNGGYVVAGYARGGSGTTGWAAHVGEEGTTRWSRTYGDDASFYAAVPRGDGYLFAGRSDADGWAVATDAGGNVAWNRALDNGTTTVYHAVPAGDGVLLAGEGAGPNGTTDGRAVELGPNGTVEWRRSLGGEFDDRFLTALRTDAGRALLVGVTHETAGGSGLGWAVMLGERGDVAWDVVYGGGEKWATIWSASPGPDGGFVLAARASSYGASLEAIKLRVQGGATAEIRDAAPDETGVTVPVDGAAVESVILPANVTESGVVSVGRRDRMPESRAPPGRLVYAVDVAVPYSLRDVTSTVELSVDRSDVPGEANVSRLALFHETDDGWRRVDANVTERAGNVTMRGAVDGFSTLAVTKLVPPRASVEAPEVARVGEPVTLTAEAEPAEGSVAATGYRWRIGERTPTGESATVTFDEPGRHEVTLLADGRYDLTGRATTTVLANDRPSVAVEAPANATVNETVQLRADVTDEVGETTVTWVVDGTERTGSTVEVAFDSPGDREVTVRVRDEYGATATRSATVSVAATPTESGPGFDLETAIAVFALAVLVGARLRGRD